MVTLMAAVNWGDVGIAVATAVGLSGLLSVMLDAYFTARLRRNELRDVWRRDRLTTAVADYLPAAASVVPLTRTAHYASLDSGGHRIAPAYTEALDARDARMSEVRKLEIPVLLFIGKEHRIAVTTYTRHLDHQLWAAINTEPNVFNDAAAESERLHALMVEAVRADFGIA